MCVELAERDDVTKSSNDGSAALKVAVAGLGTIGEGAALRLLTEAGGYELCAALVRDSSKPRAGITDMTVITEDVDAFLNTAPLVVIDALPDGEAGRVLIAQSLRRGIAVVSANKQAIAGSLEEFTELSRNNDAPLAYAAAVGGGSPMVETVREARASGEIVEITAILNGTVNYILTALANGVDFDVAVKQAQDAGFAEPDPTADLSGEDARAKISILCFEAFGNEIDLKTVATQALDKSLAEHISADGGVWRQLSRVQRSNSGEVTARLAIEKVSDESFFAGITEERNALRVKTMAGEIFDCSGKGAGRVPTVSSLFSDLAVIKASHPPAKTR